MWLVGLCLLAAAVLVRGGDQQRQQLTAVDQPPAHVVYGLLVEPWLNVSSRYRRRHPPGFAEQLGPAAARAVLQQAVVTATLLSAILERGSHITVERLEGALAGFEAEPSDQQRSLLNDSLAELQLGERLHGPVIQLEALLIAQQTDLLAVSESVAALQERADELGTITSFVNSVTATVGRRVSATETAISRLGASLRQLNASVVSGQYHRQGRSEGDVRERPTSGEQEADAGRHCSCDGVQARLVRLEAAAADRDQLADRLDAALARVQALEERQTLLLPAVEDGSQTGAADNAAQLDLSAAGTESRGTLLTREDAGRSVPVTETEVITADSVVTGGSRQAAVILGRSIQVADRVGPRSRSRLPPQAPLDTGRSLYSLLQSGGRSLAGTQARPEWSGWRPIPAADRRSRLLPPAAPAGTAGTAGTADTADGAKTADTDERDEPSARTTPTTGTVEWAAGDQEAQSTELSASVAAAPPPRGSAAGVAPAAAERAGVAPRRRQPLVLAERRLPSAPTEPARQPSAPTEPARQGRGRRPDDWRVHRASGRLLGCQPAGRYSAVAGMYEWCLFNCPIYCPPSHCVCQWAE